MSDTSETHHEPIEPLNADTMEMHRALVSLREELEAVDSYRQRADACRDEQLRGVLLHNMREEIEHACMLLEWLRRNDADFDENMASYLFTKATDILEVEEQEAVTPGQPDPDCIEETTADAPADASPHPLRLTIGSMKEAT
jgi:ferritin-like protein